MMEVQMLRCLCANTGNRRAHDAKGWLSLKG